MEGSVEKLLVGLELSLELKLRCANHPEEEPCEARAFWE